MDVREKLVELLTDNLPRCGNLPSWDNPLQLSCDEQVQRIADHLIMNGVTVQEWISVDDRLPRINVGVLVYTPRLKNIFEAFYKVDGKWEIFSYRGGEILNDEVTHWMPIPQPPKGG